MEGDQRHECEGDADWDARGALGATLVPDPEADERRRKDPPPRAEPGGDDVAQRVGKQAPAWEKQANGQHHAGYRKGEKDDRTKRAAAREAPPGATR